MTRNQALGPTVVLAFVCGGLRPSPAAAAGPCNDIPLRVTIFTNAVVEGGTGETVPAALQSDRAGEYTDGKTLSARIVVSSGTHDAVVNVSTSRRTFMFVFPSPMQGSIVQGRPSWVPGRYGVNGWINVRNITFSKQPFTTHIGSTFTGPDRATCRFGFDPFNLDAPDIHSGSDLSEIDNTPYPTSAAIVYPTYRGVRSRLDADLARTRHADERHRSARGRHAAEDAVERSSGAPVSN